MAKQHLYLVDGSGYIFRAYHRLPPLSNPEGTPVGAVYGFTAMLWKLIGELNKAEAPTHLAVIFDASEHTFRNEMYAGYKAHRPPPPEDLVPQFPLIRDAVRAFSVPCIEQAGVEADDIIASYALAARAADFDVTIVSSDKDLMQLIQPGIDLLDTMKNVRVDRAAVIEKFGVPPEQVGEVLALMGDSVDNVPGVRGIGPKTAAELIQQFGTVEALLSRLPEVKRDKIRQSLADSAADARMSRELVRLKDDLPLHDPLDALTLREPEAVPLAAFLAKHGFRSLLSKLGREAEAAHAMPAAEDAPAVAFDPTTHECVTTRERLDWWLAEAVATGRLAIDVEADSADPIRASLIGVSLAVECGRAAYVPIGHGGGGDMLAEVPAQLPLAEVIAALAPLLADDAILKIGHNLKYDRHVLARHGAPEIAPYDDTQLMSFALDGGRWAGHGLEELSTRHLGYTPTTLKEFGGPKARTDFAQVPLDRAAAFAAVDADLTLRLHDKFKPRLAREHVMRVYRGVDLPLIPAIGAMEAHGIHVDRRVLAELSTEYEAVIAEREAEVYATAGGPFTIGSPKQLGEVLFGRLGLPSGKKSGKTGAFTTDVVELERLAAAGHEIARQVLDWRQLTKLKNTYTDALQQQINPATGRVHTCYALAAAQTGRLSSNDPNLQNIPIRTELGRKIRDAFVAEPGNVLLAADYNQIELRLVAHIADVPELKRVYAEGGDVHALTAQEVFGEVTRDTRNRAKTINFSIIYGISAFGLAQRLGIERGEAGRYIELYFDRFPGIRNYMAETIAEVRETGFVTTLFGRKVHLPMIHSKVMGERQNAERAAVNARVQGTAADIIKRAMTRMPPALTAAGLGATRMLLSVHDELVFETPAGEAEAAKPVIRAVMAEAHAPAIELSVPLGVEIGEGASWGAAH